VACRDSASVGRQEEGAPTSCTTQPEREGRPAVRARAPPRARGRVAPSWPPPSTTPTPCPSSSKDYNPHSLPLSSTAASHPPHYLVLFLLLSLYCCCYCYCYSYCYCSCYRYCCCCCHYCCYSYYCYLSWSFGCSHEWCRRLLWCALHWCPAGRTPPQAAAGEGAQDPLQSRKPDMPVEGHRAWGEAGDGQGHSPHSVPAQGEPLKALRAAGCVWHS